jgi:hypothetical protein
MTSITRLTSQRDLIRQSIQGGQFIVYGYLRAKTSGTAKAGTPYYIGIASTHWRPYQRHMRGGMRRRAHDVPVPSQDERVRLFGVFGTREEAANREQALIARYGRKGIDIGGILLNRTVGGDGVSGTPRTKGQLESLRSRMQLTAEKMGVEFDTYFNLSSSAKRAVQARFANGHRGVDLLNGLKGDLSMVEIRTAERLGVDPIVWSTLTKTERIRIHARHRYGFTGTALLENSTQQEYLTAKMRSAAERMEIPFETWASLSTKARGAVAARHKRGKRGEALLDGIAA